MAILRWQAPAFLRRDRVELGSADRAVAIGVHAIHVVDVVELLDQRLDAGIPADVRNALNARGHKVRVQETPSAELGGAQVIVVLPSGVKWVGADHRREAYGIAY